MKEVKPWVSRWNSFNSNKALVHAEYWEPIITEHRVPPPRSISVDPSGTCQLHCPHCNASRVIGRGNRFMSIETMDKIVKLATEWGVRSVCVGGGGEPMLNPGTPYLIARLAACDIDVALVTNGVAGVAAECARAISYAGVSVDAATPKTWAEVKGVKNGVLFSRVLKTLGALAGVTDATYKFLLLPTNFHEVGEACRIAKDIGCDSFHLRPGSDAWFGQNQSIRFDALMQDRVGWQIEGARERLEDESFRIYGIVDKFDAKWQKQVSFKKCWACFTTCFISYDGSVGVCCDRRGDKRIMLGDVNTIQKEWGSERHWKIHAGIDPQACPRCTYSHVCEIVESVIIEDKMFKNFF